jgi:hypothetical protein
VPWCGLSQSTALYGMCAFAPPPLSFCIIHCLWQANLNRILRLWQANLKRKHWDPARTSNERCKELFLKQMRQSSAGSAQAAESGQARRLAKQHAPAKGKPAKPKQLDAAARAQQERFRKQVNRPGLWRQQSHSARCR